MAYRALKELDSRGYEVKISHVALGETLQVLYEKDLQISPKTLFSLIKSGEIRVYGLERERVGKFLDFLGRINKKEQRNERPIPPPDSLIVAYSMVDRNCRGLLTFDSELIQSRRLKTLILNKLRYKKFEITDRPVP